MNKLSTVSLTKKEIAIVLDKVSNVSDRLVATGEPVRGIILLKINIDFARNRLGRLDRDGARSFTENGVELNSIVMSHLLVKVGRIYFLNMPSSPEIVSHAISYLSEARELLGQSRDEGMDDEVMRDLSTSCDITLCHLYRKDQSEKAKYHAAQYVASARQYKCPDHLITALSMLSSCLLIEENYPEALALAEESYLIASKHYSPAHKTVVKASHEMINCLIATKDYSTADTYCRMNYLNFIERGRI